MAAGAATGLHEMPANAPPPLVLILRQAQEKHVLVLRLRAPMGPYAQDEREVDQGTPRQF
jgi:hypothetical protein